VKYLKIRTVFSA